MCKAFGYHFVNGFLLKVKFFSQYYTRFWSDRLLLMSLEKAQRLVTVRAKRYLMSVFNTSTWYLCKRIIRGCRPVLPFKFKWGLANL